jgi:hypothetical protein
MTGVEMIAAERQRQVTREGWTPEHDDSHTRSEMVVAACRYALHDASKPTALRAVARVWRWSSCWWKPKDRIRNLVRAGALIAAEIDRLSRVEHPR